MDKTQFHINADIKKAETLPREFYISDEVFEAQKKLFANTWQFALDKSEIVNQGDYAPVNLLPNFVDLPLLFSHDKDGVCHAMSNVCTHRAKLIAEEKGNGRMLTCGYHGRCFHLDGKFKAMPKFEEAENFPSEKDNLLKVNFAEWLNLLFVNVKGNLDFDGMIKPMHERIDFLPLDTLQFVKEKSKTYHVNANWALYVDNYLEGFHVPFVHPGLNEALDFGQYEYHLFEHCNLQLGIAGEGEAHFDLPQGHIDKGKNVFAYYFWLFPNMMFNFYPWGLSLNIVEPIAVDKCRVRFLTYCYKGKEAEFEATGIDETELEDESVVESVQKGMQSPLYDKGRYSPSMEKCVHHFHQLISKL